MSRPDHDDDLQKQLINIFVVEANEYIQSINQKLLVLEKGQNNISEDFDFNELLREAHSLKGAARAVNILEIEDLSHHLESIFIHLYEKKLTLVAEDFDLLFKTLDLISTLIQKATDNDNRPIGIEALIQQLDQLMISGTQRQTGNREDLPHGMEVSDDQKSPTLAQTEDRRANNLSNTKETSASGIPIRKDETIRLSTHRLDILLSLMSELHVSRIESKQRLADLAALRDSLNVWEREWHRLESQLQSNAIRNRTNFPNHQFEDLVPEMQTSGMSLEENYHEISQLNNSNFKEIIHQINTIIHALKINERKVDQLTTETEEEIRRTRMLPISTIFDAFPRVVRDLARDCGKEVLLQVEGEETEVDRAVLEQIKDPLLHLIRNCVDHGVELPELRLQKGKPIAGIIKIKALHQGGNLILEISDDGAGIDIGVIKEVAIRKNFVSQKAAEDMNEREIIWMIFKPGFSSSKKITDISGRGIGMDIVRKNIEAMNGIIRIENKPGDGIKFVLSVPLTVATTNCVLVHAGVNKFQDTYLHPTFAIPITNIFRMLRVRSDEIVNVEGRLGLQLDNEPLELRYLSDILGLPQIQNVNNQAGTETEQILIIEAAERTIAIAVGEILGTQEIVIKKLPWPFLHVDKIAGECILGSGEPAFVLNMAEAISGTYESRITDVFEEDTVQPISERKGLFVLVVDDSITTRTLEKNIIESAGYQVKTASDGLEAWKIIQSGMIDLVVSDIVMPRLDGVELCKKIRSSEKYKNLPVILSTSMDSEDDKKKGLDAGADAYLVKKIFDQNVLLKTIERLI
ncbi:hybrid sensor histidine kinase/response regulator [Pelolinea submarina]|uniref:histidine kinase n=1 Tax=Pelolinea submarina TaxID=913107 RepID=A0A347ZU09_9CHLR|nr:response regulator [Pelolinea submarina]REG10626.1 CheA signal transduction histidine kinase [Pelolinea submarina]BBB48790.1 two-component system, chemotaxis family, sensor kinase CheA [Pelolinea submarina]